MPSFSKLVLVVTATAGVVAGLLLEERQVTQTFKPSPGNFPKTGDDTIAGGIFCISLPDLATYLSRTGNNPGGTGSESPRAGTGSTPGGTGPYPAGASTDPALPMHTIFAPKTPPPGNLSLPFIAWGNGGCGTDPSMYRGLLTEIASYGYVIAADGPGGSGQGQTLVTDMRASLDWAFKGGAAKFGNVDLTRVATAGHSCGGLEAMSTAYHDERVKRIVMFNIAIFQDERRYLLKEVKVPVAWLVGGPKDMGYPNAQKDYALLNEGLPAYKASLDTGHGATYAAANGGKFGKAAVNYFEWQFRNNSKAKAIMLDKDAPDSLVSDKWTVDYKNWS